MAGHVGLIGCVITVFGLLGVQQQQHIYTVGDSSGWAVSPNNSTDFYASWASNHTFQIGDTVVFNWTGNHTATQVPKEYYDNCTKSEITFITEFGVTFKQNNTLYFLCSLDTHCEQGQKVTIVVGDGISDTGSAPSLTVGALSAFFSTIVIFLN